MIGCHGQNPTPHDVRMKNTMWLPPELALSDPTDQITREGSPRPKDSSTHACGERRKKKTPHTVGGNLSSDDDIRGENTKEVSNWHSSRSQQSAAEARATEP